MSARETAELLLWGGSCKPTAIAANSAPPNGWRSVSSPVLTHSPGTPSAFAEFQATTRGTASQAIKALEAGGYLVRWRSRADRRSATLRLTDKGHEVVARDAFEILVRAVDSLNAPEQTAMRNALHHVLITIAASGAHRHFGVCQDCAYLGGEMYCELDKRDVGPRMPTVRRTDRTGRRWSPLCPFSAEGRAPRGRTSRMSSPLQSTKGTRSRPTSSSARQPAADVRIR